MAGSRAASAREPGQIREEAALSDTARAPRTSLAGAEDRRARPKRVPETGARSAFKHAVRAWPTFSASQMVDLARNRQQVSRAAGTRATSTACSNCTRTTSMSRPASTGRNRPYQGNEAVRESIDELAVSVWESSRDRDGRSRGAGDRVVAQRRLAVHGGRASGMEGHNADPHRASRPRMGRSLVLEWCPDHERSRRNRSRDA